MGPATEPVDAATAAIVLAGGQARRMGGIDKLGLVVGGATVLDRVLAAVAAMVGASGRVVVVGPERPTSGAGITWALEAEPGGGPVPAVAAGLAALDAGGDPAPMVLTLAGDLALLEPGHLTALVRGLADRPEADAAVAVDSRRRLNPLLAVHRRATLRDRLRDLGPGDAASRMVGPAHVAVALPGEATFNLNSPADLARLGRHRWSGVSAQRSGSSDSSVYSDTSV